MSEPERLLYRSNLLGADKRVTGPHRALKVPRRLGHDRDAFRAWLVATAQAAADAAKEGGFMGFGGEQVSAGEQQMLDQVRAAIGMA